VRKAQVHADSGYTGVVKRPEVLQAQNEGEIRKDVQWEVSARPSKLAKLPPGPHLIAIGWVEHLKASIRARVEHPFHIV